MRLRSKRLVSLLLAGSMMVSMVPAGAVTAFAAEAKNIAVMAADGSTEETSGYCGAEGRETDVKWEVKQNNTDSSVPTYTLTISGNADMKAYSGDTTHPWRALSIKDQITEVIIEDGVTGISTSAFYNLLGLKTATIPASVTSLGVYIFGNDAALENVIWDAENFKGKSAEDTDKESPYIDDNGTFVSNTMSGSYVPRGMFDRCTSLGAGKELSDWLPKNFDGICSAAFRGTKFTVNFDRLNSRMNYYGVYAFDSMEKLDSFTLTDDITFGLANSELHSSNAFVNSGLKSLTVKAKTVPAGFASNCTNLKTLTLENTVQKIRYSAFNNIGITELTVPETNGKLTISKTAFMNNSQLKKVTLQGNVSLDQATFGGCGIEDFTVAEGAEVECLYDPFAAYGTTASAVTSVKNVEIMGALEAPDDKTNWTWGQMFSGSNIEEVSVSGENLQHVKRSIFPAMKKLNVIGGNADAAGYAYGLDDKTDAVASPLESVYIDVDTYQSHDGAFRQAASLKTLTIKANTVKFGSYDFQLCPALKVIDLSQCETVQYNSNDSTKESFASSTEHIPADVRIYVKNEASNPHSHASGLNANYGTVFVTDGGTVSGTLDGDTFATPEKSGFQFDGWYESADFTGDAATTPETGKTYYAKWYKTAEVVPVEKEPEQTNYVGSPVDIAVTVTAEPEDMAKIHKASLVFTDKDGNDDTKSVEKVTIKIGGNETELKEFDNIDLDSLLNPNGVAVQSSEISKDAVLSVTYNNAGEHNVKIELKGNDDRVICSQSTTVKVNEAPAAGTLNLTACTAKLEDGTAVESGTKVDVGAKVTVTFDKDFYADSNLVLSGWKVTPDTLTDTNGKLVKDITADSFTFTMPEAENGVTIEALTKTADTEDDSWDAGTVVTGVAIGAGAAVLTYHIGTELYAEQVLGKGVAVPKTRADVALKAWELAGKPAVAIDGEPLSEATQAEKWAIESGLMQNVDGSFNGAKKMSKLKALRVLDSAKKLG